MVPFQDDLLDDFNTRYGADLVGFTVVRMRGYMAVTSTVAACLPLVVGVHRASEGEVASTEFNPATNGEYLDWMLYEPFVGFPDGGNGAAQTYMCAREIDVKASRRLDELDQTIMLYAGTDSATAGTITLRYHLSLLLMQP